MNNSSSILSPFYRFVENVAVSCVFGAECIAAILYTQHHKGFCTVIAHTPQSVGSNTYHRTFFYREYISVNLKFSSAVEKKIQL